MSINFENIWKNFKKEKPNKNGVMVVWKWKEAGIIFVGDYFLGKIRLAHNNFEEDTSNVPPTHWCYLDTLDSAMEML